MSDLLKGIIGVVLWFFLTFGLYKGCNPCCDQLPLCGHDHTAAVAPPVTVTEVSRYPLDFQWSDATSYTNEGFSDYKARILQEADDTNILEIEGLYYEGEENSSSFENMGLARANQIKELFLEEIPEDRIRLIASERYDIEDAKNGYFKSATFNWIAGESGPIETLADRVIIRFPFNSVKKEFDPKIDEYLSGLAATLKETGGIVRLTGHTDNEGSSERNLPLAERRAKMIRDILRKKGVKRSQILTFTKGETDPISSNDTEDGRRNNRRVEVQLD